MDPRWKPVEKVLPVADPGAGNGFSITPNTAANWLIRSLTFTMATDATVPARTVGINITQSGVIYQRFGASATQAASLTRTYGAYTGASGGAAAGPNISIDCPTDGFWVPKGHQLNVTVDAIAAADAITSIAFLLWEFPVGPRFSVWPFVATLTEESE